MTTSAAVVSVKVNEALAFWRDAEPTQPLPCAHSVLVKGCKWESGTHPYGVSRFVRIKVVRWPILRPGRGSDLP